MHNAIINYTCSKTALSNAFVVMSATIRSDKNPKCQHSELALGKYENERRCTLFDNETLVSLINQLPHGCPQIELKAISV